MPNYSEAELAQLLAQGNVTVDGEEKRQPVPVANPPRPKKAKREKAGIPVPKENCLKDTVFKSKTEHDALLYLLERYKPRRLLYEPILLRLPSGNYSPDFMMWLRDGSVMLIEVKGAGGFKAYQSGRSSAKSLKEAAYHYTDLLGSFMLLVKKKGGGWLEKVI